MAAYKRHWVIDAKAQRQKSGFPQSSPCKIEVGFGWSNPPTPPSMQSWQPGLQFRFVDCINLYLPLESWEGQTTQSWISFGEKKQDIQTLQMKIHPWKLTWNTRQVWKMMFLFNWVTFRFHVNFQGCSSTKMFTMEMWNTFCSNQVSKLSRHRFLQDIIAKMYRRKACESYIIYH